MTTEEVFKEITSEPKWYAGKFSAQIASRIKRHYKNGIYRPDSLVRLFAKFGYSQNEITWEKK
jgi:hypothetical protein